MLLLIVGMLLCGAMAAALEIVVEPGGVLGLQDAVNQARSGDAVRIHEGIYALPTSLLVKQKSDIVISGVGEVWLICDDYYSEVVSIRHCTDVEIVGIKATHREWSSEYACNAAVLGILESHTIAVYGCELNGCGAMGVSMEYSEDIRISGCYIHPNNFCALYIYDSDDISVTHNTIVEKAALISGYGIGSLEMEGNTIAGNGPR